MPGLPGAKMTELEFLAWVARIWDQADKPNDPIVAPVAVVDLIRNGIYPEGGGPPLTPITIDEYRTWKATGKLPDWRPGEPWSPPEK